MKKQKKNYLEVLRVVAVILVIFNHTDLNWAYYHDTHSIITFMVSLLVSLAVKIDIPLFFCISGALLIAKEESITFIWKKRIARILMVLVLFSGAQYIFKVLRGKIENGSIKDFLIRLLQGNIQETFWFLYAYIAFLIVLPLLKCLARSITISEYLLLVSIVIIVEIYSYIEGVTGFYIHASLINELRICLSYGLYWISGYFIDNNYELLKSKKYIKTIVIIMFFVELVFPLISSLYVFIKYESFVDPIVNNSMKLIPLVLFGIFRGVSFDEKNVAVKLGKYCFAIYLVEQFIRVLFFNIYVYNIGVLPGVIGSTIYAILTFLGALLVAFLLKKVPLLNKII